MLHSPIIKSYDRYKIRIEKEQDVFIIFKPRKHIKIDFSCPSYAKNGCYTGTAVHSTPTGAKTEVYKGCSTFNLGDETHYYNETLQNGIEYNLAKGTCHGTPNCNEGYDRLGLTTGVFI